MVKFLKQVFRKNGTSVLLPMQIRLMNQEIDTIKNRIQGIERHIICEDNTITPSRRAISVLDAEIKIIEETLKCLLENDGKDTLLFVENSMILHRKTSELRLLKEKVRADTIFRDTIVKEYEQEKLALNTAHTELKHLEENLEKKRSQTNGNLKAF